MGGGTSGRRFLSGLQVEGQKASDGDDDKGETRARALARLCAGTVLTV